MTAEQLTLLKKELKNWQKIYEAKENITTVLAGLALKGQATHTLKNAIVDNLIIERDAEYRIKEIKERLGVR